MNSMQNHKGILVPYRVSTQPGEEPIQRHRNGDLKATLDTGPGGRIEIAVPFLEEDPVFSEFWGSEVEVWVGYHYNRLTLDSIRFENGEDRTWFGRGSR